MCGLPRDAHHQSQALRKVEKDETQLLLLHSSFARLGGGPCPGDTVPKGDASCCIEMYVMGLQLLHVGGPQKALLEHRCEGHVRRYVRRSGMNSQYGHFETRHGNK